MPSSIMWINEVDYFGSNDFIEIATPVELKNLEAFSLVVYDNAGIFQFRIDHPGDSAYPNGLQFVKIDGLNLPDGGVTIGLLRADGYVREFLTFGSGAVTALDGPLAGRTSESTGVADTNATRGLGLTGVASGPGEIGGWQWTENVAIIPGNKRNAGQTHEPTSSQGTPISGTAEADQMVGTNATDILSGAAGNDFIFGLAGDDQLSGDEGNDFLFGGSGADELNGGNGTDTASYLASAVGVGLDLVTGIHTGDAAGDSFISIENFRLTEFADSFVMDDTGVTGATNMDAGDDTFTGGAANDTVYGGEGNDDISGGDGADRLLGQDGDDTINGDGGDDFILGQIGNDVLNGGAGVDRLYGAEGNDTISGGSERDYIYGGDDADELNGDAGNDLISGGDGADMLNGGDDNDALYGEAGSDVLNGGAGNDTLLGGADADTFAYAALVDEGLDVISDFEVGVDGLTGFTAGDVANFTDSGSRTVIELNSGTQITLTGVTGADLGDLLL